MLVIIVAVALVVVILVTWGLGRVNRKSTGSLEGTVWNPPLDDTPETGKSDIPWIMKRLGNKPEDLDEDS